MTGRFVQPSGGVPIVRFAGIALVAATLLGCDSEPSVSEKPSSDAGTETAQEEAESVSDEERSAFGLPFPPSVRGVRRLPNGVEVTTRMDLESLGHFYESRLVDYEIVQPSEQKIRALGLREFMPEIRGHRYGPISVLYYSPSRQRPSEDTDPPEAQDRPDAGVGRPKVGAPERGGDKTRESGSTVRSKTDDGEPLAPGARRGEPYTPPEGSPLDKPRYRENFGKPFGDWQLP